MIDQSSFLRCTASSSSSGQSNCSLETVIDPPLQSSQSTNHQNSCSKTCPQSLESNLLIDPAHFLSNWTSFSTLAVQLGDHGVSWMWDYCAEDTSEVAWGEGHRQLGGFVVVLFSLCEDVVIKELDKPFESYKFDDGVRHLSCPKRSQSLIESTDAYIVYQVPSWALAWLRAATRVVGYSWPGLDSWILSLTASQGQSKVSAMISADPEATDHPIFLYSSAFCSPTIFL